MIFSSLLISVGLAVSALGSPGIGPIGSITRITPRPAPTGTRHHVPRAATTTGPPIGVPTSAGPPGFNITSLGLNGSGCPPGSAFYLLNNDHSAVTITFSQYEASADQTSTSLMGVRIVSVPHGFTFAIVDIDYRGFYQLDPNVKAIHDATYYFQAQQVSVGATSNLLGPVDGKTYVFRDEFNLSPTIYSPCGEDTILNVNSAVRVDNSANKDGYGYVTNDSIDASIKQTVSFQWLTCP